MPRTIELMLLIHRDETGEPEIAMTAPVLAADEEQARADLSLLEELPAARATPSCRSPTCPVSFEDLFAGSAAIYPDGHRWAADNMWTHAPVEELLPGLRRIAETLPPAPSHMLWMNWGPSPPRPDMAYSVEDDTYIALYGAGAEPRTRRRDAAWATERMREMEPLSSGIQLADENLGRRPARFVSDEHLRRLDEMRARYDPDGLFLPVDGPPLAGAGVSAAELERLPGAPPDAAARPQAAGGRARPGPRDPRTALALSRGRPAARSRAAGGGDGLVAAARRDGPGGRPHADARGQRRDGRLVVRLASARGDPLPHLAPARPTSRTRCRRRADARAPSPTGERCTTPSRTSAPASCTRASASRTRRELGHERRPPSRGPQVGTVLGG